MWGITAKEKAFGVHTPGKWFLAGKPWWKGYIA